MYSDPRRPRRDPRLEQKPNGYWYVLFNQRGKPRKWVATGIQSRYYDNAAAHVPSEVNELLVYWKHLWRENKYDPWEDEVPGRITVKQAIDRFIADHEGTDSTKKSYRTTLEPFMELLSDGVPVAAVEAKHVKRYVTQEHLSGLTPRAYFNRLRMFFAYCLEKHWIFDDPTVKVTPPAEPRGSSRSIFLPREFERIMTAAQSDVILRPDREVCLDAYELAMATGLRVGELCSRAWQDVDFRRNTIRVDDQPAAEFTVKNDPSRRIVPLWPRAESILRRRHANRISEDQMEPVFLAPRHKTSKTPFLNLDWLSKRFTEHREMAGVAEGVIHSCRHSFISYCLALSVPESKVMRFVGQVKYDTLAVYTHMLEELLQEAPGAALSRYLPGRERKEPVLLTEIALFMDGQPLPENDRQRYV